MNNQNVSVPLFKSEVGTRRCDVDRSYQEMKDFYRHHPEMLEYKNHFIQAKRDTIHLYSLTIDEFESMVSTPYS